MSCHERNIIIGIKFVIQYYNNVKIYFEHLVCTCVLQYVIDTLLPMWYKF